MLEETAEKSSENEFVSVRDAEPGDYVRIGWDLKVISRVDFGKCGRYDVYVKPDKRWFEFWKREKKYSCFDIRGFKKNKIKTSMPSAINE